jgi:GMP synthase-like glutamine amidotransferase
VRALFLQHDPGSEPGLVGEHLTHRGFEVELVEMSPSLHDGTWHGEFPDPTAYELVVPLGAIWSLYDRAQVGSWIDRELDLLRRADAAGVPVLGICFGGQALAAAHGGEVTLAERAEVGWVTIETDDPELVPPGPWMQWHSDRFVLPPGAVEVARNDVGPQAFRLRRNLAVQFHPEVDEANVQRWIELDRAAADTFITAAGSTVEAVLRDTREQESRARADVARFVDRFLDEVAQAR